MGDRRDLRLGEFVLAVILLAAAAPGQQREAARRIPVVYTTDLFHPYGDPDDHYDLATLFALPELDVRGIVIDRPQYLERSMTPGIRGPDSGRWDSGPDHADWRVFLIRQGSVLDCRFRFRATGPHHLELALQGGERVTLAFRAYLPGVLNLPSESGGIGATLRVFHRREGYGEVMASTLRNLLADFRKR